MAQIHKQFSTEQVKDLFKRYMDKQIENKDIPLKYLRWQSIN